MNHKLSIGFLCFVTMQADAQFSTMPEGNAGWVERHGWLQPYALSPDCAVYTWFNCEKTIRFGSDTLINGQSWHSMYRYGACHFEMVGWQVGYPPPPECPFSGWYSEPTQLLGMIRQDTASRTVFWYDPNEQDEFLLYDFNMGIGVYPATYNNFDYPNVQIISIDSTLLADGYHRRFNLEATNVESPFVLEGIGSSFGLQAPMYQGVENGTSLQCFSRSDIMIFPDSLPEWVSCNMHVGFEVNQALPLVELSIAPDPVDMEFTVRWNSAFVRYQIRSVDGAIVREKEHVDTNVINVVGLGPGIYVLTVVAENGELGWRRFLKQ